MSSTLCYASLLFLNFEMKSQVLYFPRQNNSNSKMKRTWIFWTSIRLGFYFWLDLAGTCISLHKFFSRKAFAWPIKSCTMTHLGDSCCSCCDLPHMFFYYLDQIHWFWEKISTCSRGMWCIQVPQETRSKGRRHGHCWGGIHRLFILVSVDYLYLLPKLFCWKCERNIFSIFSVSM